MNNNGKRIESSKLNKIGLSRIRGGGYFSSKKNIFDRFAEEYPAAFLASRQDGGKHIKEIINQLVDINLIKNKTFFDSRKLSELKAAEKSLKQKLMEINLKKNDKQLRKYRELFTEEANEKSRLRSLRRRSRSWSF